MLFQPDASKEEYIALEGNRRVVALQILAGPELLHDLSLPDALRKKLTELSDNFDDTKVEPIRAVLMSDRESARRWIELRHTGENEGRGIVNWNGFQTARFRKDKLLKFIDLIKANGNLTKEELTALAKNFPISTFDRLLANPVVRERIGITIIDGEYYLSMPTQEAVKPLQQIIADLATKKIKVSAVDTKEQQIAYINSFAKASLPKGKKLSSPQSLASLVASSVSASEPPPPMLAPTSPLDRKTLVPKDFSVAIANQKAAQVFCELQSLNVERFPVGGAVLLRTFVEASVDVYCGSAGISLGLAKR